MKNLELPVAGPSSLDEALSDIAESERNIDSGQGMSWSVVKQMLAERIYSYAD